MFRLSGAQCLESREGIRFAAVQLLSFNNFQADDEKFNMQSYVKIVWSRLSCIYLKAAVSAFKLFQTF